MSNNIPKTVVTFNQNILSLDNSLIKNKIRFPTFIEQVEVIDQTIIVRIYPKSTNFINENIYAVSFDGKILWQIEKTAHIHEESPYTRLSCKNGILSAFNWDGFNYIIDVRTGNILERKFVK